MKQVQILRFNCPIVFEFFLFFFFIGLFFPEQSHAGYLDPGSGSILVQSIISVLAFFGRIKAKIKNALRFKKGQ